MATNPLLVAPQNQRWSRSKTLCHLKFIGQSSEVYIALNGTKHNSTLSDLVHRWVSVLINTP